MIFTVKKIKGMAFAVVVAFVLVMFLYRPDPSRFYQASGVVEAEEARIGSLVGGRVAKVLVEEGEVVSKGAILVQLEPFALEERQ
ncbi:MAG: biotin/lipoyl-binding protein, partial [Bdellovibrionales bacterium]|nr:biotin/lipoyl-binding protein [Bdellovibrionales bacterium]